MNLFARFLYGFFGLLNPQQGALVQGEEAEQGGSKIQPMEEPKDKQVENGGADPDGVSPAPAISAHRFSEVDFVATQNMGGEIKPRYLIIHWSASGSLAGTLGHIRNPKSKVSAHLLVDRDGRMVQMVPFNRRAWHCGVSEWKGLEMLNAHSIGIEGINWGPLVLTDEGLRSYKSTPVPAKDAVKLPDKDGKTRWYQIFTDEQIEVIANASRVLVREYGLEDVLGHFEISPGRKSDPGPAFPLEQVRAFCYSEAGDWREFLRALKDKDGK